MKISDGLFYLLLISLPLSVFKDFPQAFSFLDGRAVTYLTPKFYLTDLLLLFLFLSNLWERFHHPARQKEEEKASLIWPPTAFLIIAWALSSLFSVNSIWSFYSYLRLLLYLNFFLQAAFRGDPRKTVKVLLIPLFLESVLALLQWFRQAPVLPLGEPLFSASTPNSPLVNFLGNFKLRVSGTFPHPNVFGGFLSLVLIWGLDDVLKKRPWLKRQTLWLFLVLSLGGLVLFLTFSQGAWAAFFLGLWGLLVYRYRNRKVAILSLVFLAATFYFIQKLPLEAPSQRRMELAKVAGQVVKERPWLGTGLGTFTQFSPPLFREPVHNLFLLIAAEGGLVSLLVWLWLIFRIVRLAAFDFSRGEGFLLVSVLQILFLGFFDHYLLTSQSGNLLFWLALGLAVPKGKARRNSPPTKLV